MRNRGFTLIEIVLAVVVIFVLASIILKSYSLFNGALSIDNDISKIASLVYKARNDTISSRGGYQYGIHFEAKKVVLFRGSTYSASDATNQNFPLSANISIMAINLIGGGSNLVFDKLTGSTAEPGSITIKPDAGVNSKIMSISANGVAAVQ